MLHYQLSRQTHYPGLAPPRSRRCLVCAAGTRSAASEQRAKLRLLEQEREDALELARTCSQRSKRLLSRVQQLKAYAEQRSKLGDTAAVEITLQTQRKVQGILDKTINRAQNNYHLAVKLGDMIAYLQHELSEQGSGSLTLSRQSSMQTSETASNYLSTTSSLDALDSPGPRLLPAPPALLGDGSLVSQPHVTGPEAQGDVAWTSSTLASVTDLNGTDDWGMADDLAAWEELSQSPLAAALGGWEGGEPHTAQQHAHSSTVTTSPALHGPQDDAGGLTDAGGDSRDVDARPDAQAAGLARGWSMPVDYWPQELGPPPAAGDTTYVSDSDTDSGTATGAVVTTASDQELALRAAMGSQQEPHSDEAGEPPGEHRASLADDADQPDGEAGTAGVGSQHEPHREEVSETSAEHGASSHEHADEPSEGPASHVNGSQGSFLGAPAGVSDQQDEGAMVAGGVEDSQHLQGELAEGVLGNWGAGPDGGVSGDESNGSQTAGASGQVERGGQDAEVVSAADLLPVREAVSAVLQRDMDGGEDVQRKLDAALEYLRRTVVGGGGR